MGQTVGEILRDTTVGDEEIIRPERRARLHKSPATDERGWLGIYKRVVKPLS
jgi:hypothetical protein